MSDEFQCLKCKSNISSLVGYHTLTDEFIECPSCKHKMEVKYDESYDEDWWRVWLVLGRGVNK